MCTRDRSELTIKKKGIKKEKKKNSIAIKRQNIMPSKIASSTSGDGHVPRMYEM